MEEGWAEGKGLPVSDKCLNVAGELAWGCGMDYSIMPLEEGCIQFLFKMSTRHDLIVIINNENIYAGFFTGAMDFEVKKLHKDVKKIISLVKSFKEFYKAAFT